MKAIYLIDGLSCAHCANKMETEIKKIEGVTSASVNFITQRMTIEFDEERQEEIVSHSEHIVKKIEPFVVIKPLLVSRKKQ